MTQKPPDYRVTVTKGGTTTNWVVIDLPLSAVKRQATRMRADMVEIEEPDGVVWVRAAGDTKWRKVAPSPSPKSLGDIQERMSQIRAEYAMLNERLDAFRVQCSGCSCRLLPDETCQCCARRKVLMRVFGEMHGDQTPDSPLRTPNTKLN